MPTPLFGSFRAGIALVLVALALIAGGCASDEVSPKPAGKETARRAPLPALAGQQTFFEGKIVADVKVGAMTGFQPSPKGEKGEEGKAERGEGARGHRRGGGGGGFGGGMGGGGTGGPPRNRATGGMPSSPPVMIHLRFTNTGSEKVEIVVADFLSPLGNFVTFPDRLTLEPGQSAEVSPMTSRIAGQVTGGQISLRLKLGDRQETKTVELKPEAPPAAPAS